MSHQSADDKEKIRGNLPIHRADLRLLMTDLLFFQTDDLNISTNFLLASLKTEIMGNYTRHSN